jgi:fructokinase
VAGVIVACGEALVDLVVAPGGDVSAESGGAPFNVARACARLGAPVSLVAAVSTDRFGQRLRADLVADGVRVDDLQLVDLPTTLALAELDPSGGATYRFYLDGTSTPALTTAALPEDTRALVVGGLGLAVEPMAFAVERLVLDAPEEVLVLVDVNYRPAAVADRDRYLARLRRIFIRADVIKASVEDLGHLAATTDAAHLLTGRARTVLLTAGAAATTVLTSEGERVVPVEEGPVVDTIGAGDTFTAGFLVWWTLTGRGVHDLGDVDAIEAAVRAAHQAAALVVRRSGADPPHLDELSPDWATG